MINKVCELCGNQTDHIEKSLILTSVNNLEDYELCEKCIETINKVTNEEEVDTVKKLMMKRGMQK